MTSVKQDILYCLRGFRKQPGFAAMAIVALGLGIGSATAIFSVVQNVLLDPFPYRDSQRISFWKCMTGLAANLAGVPLILHPSSWKYAAARAHWKTWWALTTAMCSTARAKVPSGCKVSR